MIREYQKGDVQVYTEKEERRGSIMSFDTLQEEEQSHKVKVKVERVLFPKSENEWNGWGIVSVSPVETELGFEPKLSKWKNFIIRGNIPMAMIKGQEYTLDISDLKRDVKYGEYYEVVKLHIETLDSVESQQRFLQAIVKEHKANLIIEEYPNSMIIDDIKSGVINLTTIKGIGQATADKIIADIERNKDLGALMVELNDLKLTARMIKNVLDKYGSSTVALLKARESLYNLCSVSGISFKKVDEVALARGEDKFGAKRIRAYAEHCFDEIANDGHSWVSERVFLEKAISELDIIGTYIRDYMDSEDGRLRFYWQQDYKRISSMRMYNNEKNTLRNLLRLATKYEVRENVNFDEEIKRAENKLGVTYTEEQRNAIIESMNHGVFILNGKGGTGKTTVVKGIVEIAESLGMSYQACALSGKASQVLLSKDIDSATIHRTFSIGLNDKDETQLTVKKDLIIVDESSMINAGLFSTLLSRIESGAKIVIVGDSGQLSGIGHGDVLRDLLQTKYFKTVELIQIHRQAQDSGIIELASKIRDGQQVCVSKFEGMTTFGIKKDMLLLGYSDKEAIPFDLEKYLRGYSKHIKSPQDLMDIQVVVATKERGNLSARAINTLAQSIFNDLSKEFMSNSGYDYREGDKVIVKGNSYEIDYYDDIEHYHKAQEEKEMQKYQKQYDSEGEESQEYVQPINPKGDLFNGTMGIVKGIISDVDSDKKDIKLLAVEFEGLGLVVFESNKLDSLDLAYAVTCHRLQGSTIKNVFVLLDYSAFTLLSRQWVYTAITRASKKCVLMVQTTALVKAIGTDSSGNRQTFLGDLIKEVQQKIGNLESVKNRQI